MKRATCLVVGVLGALVSTVGCDSADADGGVSWCGAADDLPCCEGSPSRPPGDMEVPFVAPMFEPVRAADDATRSFVDTGALDVAVIWRGVTDSGDLERPSRVTLEVPPSSTLVFDFARAVADFPAIADGTALELSVAPPTDWPSSPPTSERTVRLARPDGSLIAAAGTGCNRLSGGRLSALLAPFVGEPTPAVCREPSPVLSAGNWCYVGRTNYAVTLDGVAAPIAAGDTARVSVAGATYDFSNHRFAIQDRGGPHAGGTCAPAIQALCSFSAYLVE